MGLMRTLLGAAVVVLGTVPGGDGQGMRHIEGMDGAMVTYSTTGISGMTTYRLMFSLVPGMENVYAMAGEDSHPLSFPPAFQVAAPFGVDIGGVNPAFIDFNRQAEFDSWLTIGVTDGSNPGAISASPGFDFSGWSSSGALGPFPNAAIFWMDPDAGPGGRDPICMGQVTVSTSSSPRATALLQGRSTAGQMDWQAALSWEADAAPVEPPAPPDATGGGTDGGHWEECDIPDLNECISNPCANGATCLDSHNSTEIPHHAYRCACQDGFANGTCAADWVDRVALYIGICDNPDGNCDLELDECMSRPCDTGYTCLDLSEDPVDPMPNEYVCEPVSLDPCVSNPCAHDAACAPASQSGVGNRQWLLQCSEGVPHVEFSTSTEHNEITVYDGNSVESPRLLSCGGRCEESDGRACNEVCTTAQGTASQMTLAYSRSADKSIAGDLTANFTCEESPGGGTSGRRTQGIIDDLNGRISPSVCGTSYVVVSVQDANSPYAGMQTLQLSIELSRLQGNLYIDFGSVPAPMVLPPAFQGSGAFGVDIGGINPGYFSVSLEAEIDSWLTVGATDGSLGDSLSSVGIDWSEWTVDSGITVIDGGVFLMDPWAGPSGSVVVAQITVPTGSNPAITLGAQGHLADDPSNDWQCGGATWLFTEVVELTDGGVADLSTSNATVPNDAYICTCTPGFANGVCQYDYIEEYDEQCTVPYGGNCDVDVDECVSKPCAYGAACVESNSDVTVPPNIFHCGCPPGVAGGYCAPGYLPSYASQCNVAGGNCEIDIDECTSNPCQNGAICQDSSDSVSIPLDAYSCTCAAGYANGICAFEYTQWLANYTNTTGLCSVVTGGNCDMDLDECISTPCQHDGVCTESSDDPSVPANRYHCECSDEWSTSANTDCSDCHIGKYFTSHELHVGGCKNCFPGTFSDVPGQLSCTDCPAGKHVETPGADSRSDCHNCVAGQFSHQGAANCTRCPPGQYQASQGQASCNQCEPGSVTDMLGGVGARMCTECDAGQFSASSTVACATCPPGSVTEMLARTGATTCTQCRAGSFSASSTVACATCPPGSVTETLARTGATTCTECRAGQFSQLSVSPCLQCPAGAFSPQGSTDCKSCGRPRCRFFPDDSDVAFACTDPQWVASPDQSTCVECPAGREPSTDRSHCAPCQPGLASEDGVRCLMCNDTAVNRNQSSISNDARTACVPCGPGEEANAYASECVNCPAGKFAPCTASGCSVCAVPLLVTRDRTGCVPSYRCPAAMTCAMPCANIEDCYRCPTGSVSAGGEDCYFCSDNGPGWVANDKQTACIQCPPGQMPSEDRSICVACNGDYISMLGSECQRCSITQVANPEHTKCLECGYGEVADNGVCKCGENYYNSSDAVIECGETCNIDKHSSSVDRTLHQPGQAACSRCPPCVRCPIGNGLSSTPLINPGFGLPKAYQGHSIAQLLYADELMIVSGEMEERPVISVYKCLVTDFCSGDHFSAERHLITHANAGTVLKKPGSALEEEWRLQLVSLAAGARIRVESENEFSESTLGSSLKDLETDQLATILYAYYVRIAQSQQTLHSAELEAVHMELAAAWRQKESEPIFESLQATFTDISDTVVVPDEAFSAVKDNSSYVATSTIYSCDVGHSHDSPLCSLCEPGYAGGSTHTCKHCTSGTTGFRVIGFLLLLAVGWMFVTWLPTWILAKAKVRMQSNLDRTYSEGSSEFRVVGASGPQGGSAFTYSKIIVSHFQVLLQFSIIMHVRFPKGFQDILDYLSVFKGDLLNYLNLKCAVQLNLYSGFAVTMGFAPVAFVACLAFNTVQNARQARKPKKDANELDFDTAANEQDSDADAEYTMKNKMLNQMFAVLFCIYPFLATKICHVFKCVTLKPSGTAIDLEEWQQYNMEVDCSDTTYKSLQSVAVVMFFVYPIGVPAMSTYVFWKNYSRLHGLQSAPVVRNRAVSPWSPAETLPWWHGDRNTFYFMVRDYSPRWYFWEIVEFIRKFALTGLLIFAEQGSASQIVFGITLAFGFGLLNAIVRPYVDARTNTFRILSDCSLFITLLIVLVLHFKDTLVTGCEWLTETKLQWILIGLNFVFLFLAVNQEMLRRLFMLYRQSQLVGILYNPDYKLQGSDGQCATLYRGQYRATLNANAVSAAVKVRRFDPEIEMVETALMLECDSHPNIVKLFKIEQEGLSSYVAMELGDCSLKAAISKVADGSEYEPVAVCKAIIEAVRHLHNSGFVHGNITPANVVMFANTPKLCGFSCARRIDSHVATEMNTLLGTQGYQPLEIAQAQHGATTEVHHPEAVDVFGVGCTMFYVLSGGTEAFRTPVARAAASFGFTVGTPDVELNLLAGESGIELTSISAEGKHLLPMMLRSSPGDRLSLEEVLEHALFWTWDRRLQYLSDIAAQLPEQTHRSKHAFINEIEQLLDSNLGPYNEKDPGSGGSWSRAFSDSYPSAGGWGVNQRPPESDEHDYFIFGAVRRGQQELQGGRKEARGVGLIKFIRSVYMQRTEHVEAFRFPSELELCKWLLEPFPFLLMGVMAADERCGMGTMSGNTANPSASLQRNGSGQPHPSGALPQTRPSPQAAASDLAFNPLSADGVTSL